VRVFKNILITLALLCGSLSIAAFGASNLTKHFVMLMIVVTSLWASIVSSQLEFRKYKTLLSNHPVLIFLGHLMLWVLVFPVFLTVREKILEGTAERKDGFVSATPQVDSRLPASNTPTQGYVAVADLVPPPLPTRRQQEAPRPTHALVSAPAVQPVEDRLAQIQKLADFRAQGILSEEEFQTEKRRLLG